MTQNTRFLDSCWASFIRIHKNIVSTFIYVVNNGRWKHSFFTSQTIYFQTKAHLKIRIFLKICLLKKRQYFWTRNLILIFQYCPESSYSSRTALKINFQPLFTRPNVWNIFEETKICKYITEWGRKEVYVYLIQYLPHKLRYCVHLVLSGVFQ